MMCLTLSAEVPDPCPRKVKGDCLDCQWSLTERAAIIQFDGKTTRSEADRLARQQAAESMRRASAQRELFEPGET
jgi:hypothetical protein